MIKPTGTDDELRQQIDQFCEQQRGILMLIVQTIAAAPESEPSIDTDERNELRRRIDRIKAKEFCSADEAALLLDCSAQHLRNKVEKTMKGETEYPIPHANLDGPVTFPVQELLEWARSPKNRAKKGSSSKNKTPLQAVAAGNRLR